MVPNNNISEVTGILNLKPFTGLNVAASYSLLNGVQNTFGLALGVNLAILNIFVACDYIPMYVTPQYIPLNEATTHLQIGASFSLWKMKKR
jgi:presenilin-like A22 family membrane protease